MYLQNHTHWEYLIQTQQVGPELIHGPFDLRQSGESETVLVENGHPEVVLRSFMRIRHHRLVLHGQYLLPRISALEEILDYALELPRLAGTCWIVLRP